MWVRLPLVFTMHLIERNPKSKLPEGPWSSTGPILDPKYLPRGHHICFAVSNYDSFIQTLEEKGIKVFEKTQPNGKTKQVFFFDPDDGVTSYLALGAGAASADRSSLNRLIAIPYEIPMVMAWKLAAGRLHKCENCSCIFGIQPESMYPTGCNKHTVA